MDPDSELRIHGNAAKGASFVESVRSGSFLFSMVMSYTATCEIPGLTIAGPDVSSFRFTPPADAEYLHYGYCKTISHIPMTPDGKPTPALLTKAALESSSIAHMIVNAGSLVPPRLPFIETALPPGNNIRMRDAMTVQSVARAVDYGRIVGRSLAPLADCLVVGESVPAGTTTAMAVLHGLGFRVRVSSSMPQNPSGLKEDVVRDALARCALPGGGARDDGTSGTTLRPHKPGPGAAGGAAETQQRMYEGVAGVGDPMIPFVAGMLSSASMTSKVMLAGGTQMAAVLAFASGIGFDDDKVGVGTTSYVAADDSADFVQMMSVVSDVPAIVVNPGLRDSAHAGLRAYADGYAKEGVGAGGCIISAMLKTGIGVADLVRAADAEYERMSGSGCDGDSSAPRDGGGGAAADTADTTGVRSNHAGGNGDDDGDDGCFCCPPGGAVT